MSLYYCDELVHIAQFASGQVIWGIFPGCESHVLLCGISSVYDDFSGSMSVCGIVHLVLYR